MDVVPVILVSLIVHATIVLVLRLLRQAPDRASRLAPTSMLVLGSAILVLSIATRPGGTDLSTAQAASYDLSEKYLASSAFGVLALAPYMIACVMRLAVRSTVLALRTVTR